MNQKKNYVEKDAYNSISDAHVDFCSTIIIDNKMPAAEPSIKELSAKGEEAESNADIKSAISFYKAIIALDNLDTDAYNKLMKLYRKTKALRNELAIVNKAIKAYEAYYKKHRPKHRKAIDEISNKLNKSLSLVTKKGMHAYEPEPIGKWRKRQKIVEKKLSG